MKTILPRISEWSWFSEEKQLNFNGHLLAVGEHRILVDPPPMGASDMALMRQGGYPDYIILTNRDHEREAVHLRQAFNCQVMAPELDAQEMTLPIDKTFKDGELLPGGIWVVHLSHQKSPGESALFLQQGKGVLIVGDGVIGHPPGSLRLLPPEKYANIAHAREGLRRLLKYSFDSLLVGDGTSILTGAKLVLEQTLAHE
jgi:glyoxylase-like metal-dependent hydrolase (beta-lactamase superfamily II)